MKNFTTRYLSLIALLFVSSGLFAQEWTFKRSLTLDVGARVYDTDLGIAGGLDVGLGGMVYNVNQATSGLVFTTRVFFNNFSKSDRWDSVKREYLGMTGGFGLHINQIFFGTVKVGYLKLLNSNAIEEELNANGVFFGGAELSAEVFKFEESGLALNVTIESGLTFEDAELIDRHGDVFQGTGYAALRLGIVKKIGVKNKLAKQE